ncbi:unnamed protein product [Rhizophagus irregularis]|nr:unnamed protein product [Rhizophagus irregularis]
MEPRGDLHGGKSNFNKILSYVKEIRYIKKNVKSRKIFNCHKYYYVIGKYCCTLGILNESQAKALIDARLTAYNYNLDTSRTRMLHTLATMPQHPESVPINALVQVEGTGTLEETRSNIYMSFLYSI